MSSTVNALGGSFFSWFQDEVLPYMLGTLYIIIMITGFILNGILITTIRKKNMLEIRTNRLLFELAISDLVACVLFIFPAIIVAFWRKWELTDIVCRIHGTVFVTCYMITFGMFLFMAVERVVRTKNFPLHDRFFLKSKGIAYISALIWFISIAVAIIPQSGWVTIKYDFYQAACVPEFGSNAGYLSIVFVMGFGFCFITYVIAYGLIFDARKKQLEGPKKSGAKGNAFAMTSKTSSNSNNNSSVAPQNGKSTGAPKVGWGAKTNGTRKSKFNTLKIREKMKKATRKAKVTKMFSNSNKDPDFTLAVTYFIAAVLMMFLWLPYLIISFVSISDKGLWGGYRSIVSVVAISSYCLKPAIYLAHNHKFRAITKETLPDKVVEKATKVGNSINEALKKIDNIMFMSASTKKFRATIKTTIFAKRWLNKARANIRARRAREAENGTNNGTGYTLSTINERNGAKATQNRFRGNDTKEPQKQGKNSLRPNQEHEYDAYKPKLKNNGVTAVSVSAIEHKRGTNQAPKDKTTRTKSVSLMKNSNENIFKKRSVPQPKRREFEYHEPEDPFGTPRRKSIKPEPYAFTKPEYDNETEEEVFESENESESEETESEESDDETEPIKSKLSPKPLVENIDNTRVPKPKTPIVEKPFTEKTTIPPLPVKDSESEPIQTGVQHKRASIVTSNSTMPIIINNIDGLPEIQKVEPRRRRSEYHSLNEYNPSKHDASHRRNTVAAPLLNGQNIHASSVPLVDNPTNGYKINDPPYTDRADYYRRDIPEQMPTYRLPFLAENNTEDQNKEANQTPVPLDTV